MGFFKKLFKGVKKVFKKIGKGIKKAVGKVGKFMGKLGIVGQIGLGLLLPGVGSMMGSMFGKLAGSLMTSSIGIVKGAGQVINAAVNIGTKAGNVFSSITEGVTKVVGEVAGATLNKLGVKNIGTVSLEGKGFGSVWDTAQTAISDVAASGRDLFSMDTLTATNQLTQKAAEEAVTSQVSGMEGPGEMFEVPQQAPAQLPGVEPAQAAITGVEAPKPSLLSQAATRAKEAVVGAPEQLVKTGVASLATLPRDATLAALQGPPEVTYDVRQSAVPDIGFAGIGQEYAQPAFDPISYFDQNQTAIAQSPFGFNARIYNDATYARNMQSYGFQTPMYGMA